jgi:predicted HTH domain antitoxin
MHAITIPYFDDLLLTTGQSRQGLELRFLLAIKLFELRRLSLGKAAEFCDKNKISFMVIWYLYSPTTY